MKKLIKFGY